VLVLHIRSPLSLKVGSLGLVRFDSGYYFYVGSARGPGGLSGRVRRHMCGPRRVRWHIDYLTSNEYVERVAVAIAVTLGDLEEVLARELLRGYCIRPAVRGFGCSDRRSETHLFRCICEFEACLGEVTSLMERLGLKPRVLSVGDVCRWTLPPGEL